MTGESQKRAPLVSRVCLILFVCTVLVGVAALQIGHVRDGWFYFFAIAPAIPVSFLLKILVEIMPDMVGPSYPPFPLNILLPMVFSSLLLMVVTMCWNVGDPLVQPASAASALLIWLQPSALVALLLVQAIALTAAARLSAKP